MFDSLLKAVVGIAVTPLAVVADVVTLGGTLTDRDEPYTSSTLGKVVENIEDAIE